MKYIFRLVISMIIVLGIYAIYATVDTLGSDNAESRIRERKNFEKAYFDGQHDALLGDVRIKKVDSRTWVWTKTPWPDTSKPFADTIHVVTHYEVPADK